MKLPPCDYQRPATVAEAVALLEHHGEDARPIAGGQSLVPLMAMRLARPALLVDLAGIDELTGLVCDDGAVHTGAMVTQAQIEDDPCVAEEAPLLSRAVRHVAHRPIRNRGTVGGSIAHGDPAAELPLAAMVAGAAIELTGPTGTRQIDAASFFTGYFSTAAEPAELVTSITWPASRSGCAFVELARRHGDFALTAAAADVVVTDATIVAVRAGLGAVGATPVLLDSLADSLVGRPAHIDLAELRDLCHDHTAHLEPPADVHATSDYRRRMAAHLAARAISDAITDAGPRDRTGSTP